MMTTKKSDSGLHDPYTDQLAAARYRAERDQAREELARLKRDRSRDVSMDVYELLPPDERAAIAWVREHGGLEQVKLDWLAQCNFGKVADRIGERLGVCVEGCDAQDAESRIMDALDNRLMSGGMEWPRFEDGELVRPNDKLLDKDGDWFRAVKFEFTCDWWSVTGYQCEGFGELSAKTRRTLQGMAYGERVKRPAPKALDADGAEIRVGDTVYDTELANGDKFTVESIDKNGDVTAHGNKYILTQRSVAFTHRAPVLAADGKPLRAGEMVYSTENGAGFTVIAVDEGSADVHVKWGYDFEDKTGAIAADQLTHEQPDSWEQLEEDARKKLDDGLHENDEWVLDLVRRAKKLAGDAE